MIRDSFLTIRTNAAERQLAAAVAERLERTESDTVRLLLRREAERLGLTSTANEQHRPKRSAGVSV